MHPEAILSATQRAFETNQAPNYIDLHASRLAMLGFVVEGLSAVIQSCTEPDFKTLAPTIMAAFAFMAASILTENSQELSHAIESAFAEKGEYTAFAPRYVTKTILPRIMNVFDVGGTLEMGKKTSEVFQAMLAARLLEKAADFQSQEPITPPHDIEPIVSGYLHTHEMPEFNRTYAAKLRTAAEERYWELVAQLEGRTPSNWSLTELENAANSLGDVYSERMSFELYDAFRIYNTRLNTPLSRRPAVSSQAAIFQDFHDTVVTPQLNFAKISVRQILFYLQRTHQALSE